MVTTILVFRAGQGIVHDGFSLSHPPVGDVCTLIVHPTEASASFRMLQNQQRVQPEPFLMANLSGLEERGRGGLGMARCPKYPPKQSKPVYTLGPQMAEDFDI